MSSKKINTRNDIVTLPNSGMNKDMDPLFLENGDYTHAINSQINSHQGDSLLLQNEPATLECISLPKGYKVIGNIALRDSKFAIFSTNNISSEIGVLDEKCCEYVKIVNDTCLGFSTNHLIKGVSKENVDGSESTYWIDDFNNNRFLNLSNVPYTFTEKNDDCKTKVYTTNLDCNKLNIDQEITIPNSEISLSKTAGSLPNGSYQVAMAYSINKEKVTSVYAITSPQQVFEHENTGKAIDVTFTNLDRDFDTYKVYLIATIAQQTTVYEIGDYTTTTDKITITNFVEDVQLDLGNLFLQKVIYNKSKDVISINNQLLWIGADVTDELNYQKQALKIKGKWIAYSVPKDYYKDGGTLVGYMRDESYAFAIQWLSTTGVWSPGFPLVGRKAAGDEKNIVSGKDIYESKVESCKNITRVEKWQAYNTASGPVTTSTNPCRLEILGTGNMAYTESSEKYPDNSELWGEEACKPIRHFKFPDDCVVPRTHNDSDDYMIILGIEFSNIERPKDKNGKYIDSIVGYRIVRSDRTNNKSIISKGLLYNTGQYERPISLSEKETTLYPNYPFNDLGKDLFLNKKKVKGGTGKNRFTPLDTYNDDVFTYHSPSHSFAKPSFGSELRIYGESYGTAETVFNEVYNHPKNKLLTDAGFVIATLLGVAEGYFATKEKECETTTVKILNAGINGATGVSTGNALLVTAWNAYLATIKTIEAGQALDPTGVGIEGLKKAAKVTFEKAAQAALIAPLVGGGEYTSSFTTCDNVIGSIPTILRALNGVALFSFYFQQGFNTALNAIDSFAKFQQYAYQINAYGHYNKFLCSKDGDKRRFISDINYLNPVLQNFEGTRVNNFRRESSVIMRLNEGISRPVNKDNSRQTMTKAGVCGEDDKSYKSTISSHYAAIKNQLIDQYGQIDSITWLDTGECFNINKGVNYFSTGVVFGGDTYLTRFTLKRKQHYFNQTAFNENDGFEFDYKKYYNILYPSYWADTFKYDSSKLVSLTPEIPNDQHSLDCKESVKKAFKTPFIVNDRYFYLFNSGIVDFYVESEYNLDLREYEEQDWLRHYDRDKFTDLSVLFRHDHIEFDNQYLYDKSLLKQLTENAIYTQNQNLGKTIAFDCCVSYPNRVFWSLPYYKDQIKDSWGFYLPNNYYDFPYETGDLITAKALNRTNIAFLFSDSGPYLHQAIDQLETDNGIKVTLGDGGLFARQPQPIITTDVKYGNAQSKFAVTNTQYGLLYPSPSQGRLFLMQANQLKEINQHGMNWWLRENMPFQLPKCIKNFNKIDNPLEGIGYLTSFDNIDEVFYITKIDYCCKEGAILEYNEETDTLYKTIKGVKFKTNLQDRTVFDDASWTLSYNAKLQRFISFHDWHPYSIIQTETRLLSVNHNNADISKIWKHNERCDRYCYFYDTQYSWDVEYVQNNKTQTTSLQSIEYNLECYKYTNECRDKFHLLYENFSEAFIYNTEQISGLLKFNLDNGLVMNRSLSFPSVNIDYINIKYSKVEQKYRFNQFWDIVKDRGQLTTEREELLITECNGYKYDINSNAVFYDKNPYQRKRFRHNWNKVYLRKIVDPRDGMSKMILKFQINKQLISPR